MNSVITEMCIYGTVLILLAFYAVFYYMRGNKERLTAAKDKSRAETLYGEMPDYDKAPVSYITSVNVDEHYAYVAGSYSLHDTTHGELTICIKKFPYDSSDETDMAFAIREAEELKEKLLEK